MQHHALPERLPQAQPQRSRINIAQLVGAGDKIGLVLLPCLIVGVSANAVERSAFAVGGPAEALRIASTFLLSVGVALWAWSAFLIVTRVPQHELITNGPFALVKHPLYTSVALFVLPWLGFLLNTWLGAALGIVLYLASRRYAVEEEADLAHTFGAAWAQYRQNVRISWL